MLLIILPLVLVLLFGWGYWLVAVWSLWLFMRDHHAAVGSVQPYMPPVSVLKPIKGLDAQVYENFASYCRQAYPIYELLFGVRDADDPVVEVVRQLQRAYPLQPIRLIVADPPGANPKSALLDVLAREACHDVLAISDSDVRVGPDYLRQSVAALADPAVGAVTCPYRSCQPRGLAAHLEALYLDTHFLPSAIVAHRLGVNVSLGASVLLRRSDLQRVGGYAGIVDHLTDDYQIGRRLTETGLSLHLSPHVVDNVMGPSSFGETWHREVRWMRGIARNQPRQYPGLILTFCIPVAMALVAASGAAWWSVAALGLSIVQRCTAGWGMMRLIGAPAGPGRVALIPLRDCLSVATWLAGTLCRTVRWRGEVYALAPDGRISPLEDESVPRFHARLVRSLDAVLRRRQGIYDFSDDARCLLRGRLVPLEQPVTLADGTHLEPGEEILELHLWNEHLPQAGPDGPTLGWAVAIRRQLDISLREAAKHLRRDPALRRVRALRGDVMFFGHGLSGVLRRAVARFGFECRPGAEPRTMGKRLRRAGESLLMWALVRVYNPGARSQTLVRQPHEVWMSRQSLMNRYGSAAPVTPNWGASADAGQVVRQA